MQRKSHNSSQAGGEAHEPAHVDADSVRSQLEATGQRVTGPRMQVLASLLKAKQALSHHDLEAALAPQQLDRVTLYRVLDWLVEQGLAVRMAGADRVSRYAATDREHGAHAHFQCSDCGKMICLEEVSTRGLALNVPRGYRAEAAEVTVRGKCAQCN